MNRYRADKNLFKQLLLILHGIVFLTLSIAFPALANKETVNPKEEIIDQAKAVWLEGAPNRALEILDQEGLGNSSDPKILRLRGDIFATTRRDQEAIQAYDALLLRSPNMVGVRWAKWSVFGPFRAGK